ncbi:MAG: DUF2827 family protein [Sphingomonadaceae bacterium]|nr:DUF2827 family protein [Sphingomonadaceae bacterium]
MTGLRAGVTFSRPTDDVTQMLWSSGINQNAVLLLLLLQRLETIGSVVLVDASLKAPPHPLGVWSGIPTLSPDEAAEQLDLVIECGGRCPPHAMNRLRDRGGRLVSYMAGNAMAMNFECVSSNLAHGEIISEAPFDAVWITPQHWRMNRAHCEITRTPRTRLVPHIWEPVFLEAHARSRGVNPFYRPVKAGGTTPWRLGVFDPNINVLKTFHIPLFAAEHAYRAAPQRIGRVLLFNAQQLIGVPHFDDVTTAMDLFKAGKLFAEARHSLPEALAHYVDAVVTHQWENDLNYLYWDVLWTGHPLIHNSGPAREVGYYYRDFDPEDGGRVIADALARHAERASDYRAEALSFLDRFRIDNAEVLRQHRDLIDEVMA